MHHHLPTGSKVSVHYMPESFYETWEHLRKKERAVFRRALKKGGAYVETWRRAARKLRDHEKSHCTD